MSSNWAEGGSWGQPFRVILHPSLRPGELVVHRQNRDGDCYWGHYHRDALTDPKAGEAALLDYAATCAALGLNPLYSVTQTQ